MKFNSVLLSVIAALSVAQGAQMNAEANGVVARAAEPEPQGENQNGNNGNYGYNGINGNNGIDDNLPDCDDNDDDINRRCNSASGLSLSVFGSVAGVAVIMAAML
ncbi:hypothetical protein BST61_g6185 [Cercospora zeina]